MNHNDFNDRLALKITFASISAAVALVCSRFSTRAESLKSKKLEKNIGTLTLSSVKVKIVYLRMSSPALLSLMRRSSSRDLRRILYLN